MVVEEIQISHAQSIEKIKDKLGLGENVVDSEYVTVKQFDKWKDDTLMPEIRSIRKWTGQIKNWIYILISAVLLLGFFISIGVLKVSF